MHHPSLDMEISAASPRLAILGGAPSRDAFGRDPAAFGVDLVMSALDIAPVSAVAAPVRLERPNFRRMPADRRAALRDDLAKTLFDRLAAVAPDWILIDLAAERHDLGVSAQGGVVTLSPGLLDGSDALMDRRAALAIVRHDWPGVAMAGALAVRRMIERIRASAPQARIAVHRVRWATHVLTRAGVRAAAPGELAAARAANARLTQLHAAIEAAAPDATIIEAPERLRVMDPDHRWGRGPTNFVGGYYAAVRRTLLREIRASRTLRARVMIDWPPGAADGADRRIPNATLAARPSALRAFARPLPTEAFRAADTVAAWSTVRSVGASDPGAPWRLAFQFVIPGGAGVARLDPLQVEAARLGDARAAAQLAGEALCSPEPAARGEGFGWAVHAALCGADGVASLIAEGLLAGEAVARDDDVASGWLRQAERRGEPRGLELMARRHAVGEGVSRDPEKAAALLRRAVRAGALGAADALAALYDGDALGAPQPEKARYWRRVSRGEIRPATHGAGDGSALHDGKDSAAAQVGVCLT